MGSRKRPADWSAALSHERMARAEAVGERLAAVGLGDVAFMILGWIEMCQRPVGSAFQRRTLRRYQAR